MHNLFFWLWLSEVNINNISDQLEFHFSDYSIFPNPLFYWYMSSPTSISGYFKESPTRKQLRLKNDMGEVDDDV